MNLKFLFKIIDWKIDNPDKLIRDFKTYMAKLKDWKYVIDVRTDRESRTLRQNRAWFWVIVDFLAKYHEVTKKQMHAHIKSKYLTIETYDPISDSTIETTRSSTSLSTKEFTMLIQQVKLDYIEEYNLAIPDIVSSDYY